MKLYRTITIKARIEHDPDDDESRRIAGAAAQTLVNPDDPVADAAIGTAYRMLAGLEVKLGATKVVREKKETVA